MLAKIPELSKLHDRSGSVESRLINCPPFAIFGRVGSSFADARPFFAKAGRDPAATQASEGKLAGTFPSQLTLSAISLKTPGQLEWMEKSLARIVRKPGWPSSLLANTNLRNGGDPRISDSE